MKRLIFILTFALMATAFLQVTRSANQAVVTGATPFQGSRCFDVDPGIGDPSRDDHYRWAQQYDSTKLMNNLAWKIGIIFNCQYVSNDQVARGFGEMSAIVANYVSNPACFNNDPGVAERDGSKHEQWARGKTRGQVRDNLQWKAVAAMKCLNRDYQVAFFADESAVLARIPSGNGGGATGSSGGSRDGTCAGAAGYSVTIAPNPVRAGGSITVHVTVPGGAPPNGSWVGVFHGNEFSEWSYLADLRPNFTRDFHAGTNSGGFEIRVFLDRGNNLAVRCPFTVQ